MGIEVVSDENALAARAADIICALVHEKPAAVLGLPTGSTPVPTYVELARREDARTCDLRHATAFAVDEFLDGERTTPGTNSAFFRQYLRVGLHAVHVPNPGAADPETHIAAYAEAIRRSGGMDLCVLGVGVNGHVAFNEPGSLRDSRARVVALTPETRQAHAAGFGSLDAVPRRGVTLGVADILEARRLLVLAAGATKAAIVARALEGAVSDEVPASFLRDRADATWLLDEAAASHLTRA
jgi:glucosamine-6-phosphate deaminase